MKKEHILIVDDDPSIRKITHDILLMQGYEITIAENVSQGIKSAIEVNPDLVLSDVMMPDGSGFEILDAVRKHPNLAFIPFIFMSGEAVLPQDIRKGMISGADDYLTKPFKAIDLITSIETRLQRQNQIQLAIKYKSGLPDFFQGNFETLLETLDASSISDEQISLMAIKMERFERFKQILGYDKSKEIAQEYFHLIYQHFSSGFVKDYTYNLSKIKFFTSYDPEKIYLIFEDCNEEQLLGIAAQVLEMTTKPLQYEQHQLHIIPGIGLLAPPYRFHSSQAILDDVDIALYKSSVQGGNKVILYHQEMEGVLRKSFHWENEIQSALQNNLFELFYQPQYDLRTGKLLALEALIRLKHPDHGFISPGEFIPTAEDSGLIIPVGIWVLEQACEHINLWRKMGVDDIKVAINISLIQFQEKDFIDKVQQIIKNQRIDSKHLEMELTESLLIEDFPKIEKDLKILKDMGLTLSIDDFGTGYSSLYYLNQLPFDTLKIDQSFVKTMNMKIYSQAIPRAIIDMGHGLNMKILAEGIETQEQLNILQALGCDYGQGYHLGRPVPFEKITKILATTSNH